MKRIIAHALALALALPAMAEMRQAVILHQGDSQIVYYLSDSPTITFEGQDMVIATTEATETVPMADIDYWTIGLADFSALDKLDVSSPSVHVADGIVAVHNPDSLPIAIYNLSGVLVATSSLKCAEFNLDRGIYIVTIGNKSLKIKN